MLRFVELCVELRRGRTAKDGLLQYKNVSQNTNAQSIEIIIKHFIKLADAKVVEAQSKADAAAGEIDVDDLEETETPESMLLGSVSPEQSKDRTDRALVTPWLKFLWEAYRTALDILRNNARLEVPYQVSTEQAGCWPGQKECQDTGKQFWKANPGSVLRCGSFFCSKSRTKLSSSACNISARPSSVDSATCSATTSKMSLAIRTTPMLSTSRTPTRCSATSTPVSLSLTVPSSLSFGRKPSEASKISTIS